MASGKTNWGAIIVGALAVTAAVAVGVYCFEPAAIATAAAGLASWLGDGIKALAGLAVAHPAAAVGVGAGVGALAGGFVGRTCATADDLIHKLPGASRG